MSQENVEIVRRSWEEFQAGMERGDPAAIFDLGLAAEDFEWIVPEPLPDRLVWRGREEFVEFICTWTAEFDNWSIRLERLIDAGEDRVVSLTVQTATGKGSGVPVDLNVGQVVELEDGRQVRVTNYLSHAEALEAAGLSEQAMSEENVEIVRGGYEAFDRGDMPSWLSRFDPEMVIHENADFPDSLIYRGHAGALQWVESVNELWDDARLDPQTFRSGGEFVVVSCRATGRGRGSGIPVDVLVHQVFRLRNSKVVEAWAYNDEAEALEAAGLSE